MEAHITYRARRITGGYIICPSLKYKCLVDFDLTMSSTTSSVWNTKLSIN